MKQRLIISIFFVLSLALALSVYAYKGQKTTSGISQSWGTTKNLDELYALKIGWTIVRVDEKGNCSFDKASWDEIDGDSALYRDLLKEADVDKNRNVTSSESYQLLQRQKKYACMNARRRNIY